jgi:hypothetical protein
LTPNVGVCRVPPTNEEHHEPFAMHVLDVQQRARVVLLQVRQELGEPAATGLAYVDVGDVQAPDRVCPVFDVSQRAPRIHLHGGVTVPFVERRPARLAQEANASVDYLPLAGSLRGPPQRPPLLGSLRPFMLFRMNHPVFAYDSRSNVGPVRMR